MRTIRISRSVSTCVLAMIVALGGVSSWMVQSRQHSLIPGQTASIDPAPMASPMVPASAANPNLFVHTECADWQSTLVAQRVPSPAEQRRQKFEEEYGIHQQSDSPVVQAALGAQYHIDDVLFTLQEASVHEYDLHNVSGNTSSGIDTDNPLLVALRDAKVKTVISPYDKQTGSRFVGVKLVFPVRD